MKLIIAVVHGCNAAELLRALHARGFQATVIDTTGRLAGRGNVTMLIGVQELLVAEALRLVKQHCQSRTGYINPLMPVVVPGEFFVSDPLEVQVGGATIYVVNVERYERIA